MQAIKFLVVMLPALIIVALAAAFIILLIGKLGIRDEIIAKAPKFISRLFDCDFCLSFWVAIIIAVVIAIIFNSIYFALVPIISTPITRVLI